MADEIGGPQNSAVRISRGDKLRLTADMANLWSEGARRALQVQRTATNQPPKTKTFYPWVWVRNDSGSDRDQWETIKLDAILQEYGGVPAIDDQDPAFSALEPADNSCHAVLMGPVQSGDTQRAYTYGLTPALVFVNDATDSRCGPKAGQYTLDSSPCGPWSIVWKPDGTGDLLCWIEIGDCCPKAEQSILTVKADACIPIGSTTATATVQKPSTGGGWEDDTAYSPLTIDNSDCRIFATKGQIFQVTRAATCSSVDPAWIPVGSFGLSRLVSVASVIAVGASGTAKVLTTATNCSIAATDSDTCEITAWNFTDRAIAVDVQSPDVETLWAEAVGCCWYLKPAPRARRAYCTNGGTKMQTTDSTTTLAAGPPSSVAWIDFPTWPGIKPSVVRNMFNHAACPGAKMEIIWDERSHDWYVSDVIHIGAEVMIDVSIYGTNPPQLRKHHWLDAALEGSGPGACQDASITPVFNFVAKTVVIDVYVDGTDIKQDLQNEWVIGSTGDATETIIGLTACS